MSATINGLTPLGITPLEHQHHELPQTTLPPSDPFAFDLHDNNIHLLLCASGSVATIKIPNILTALSSHPNLRIKLIFTGSATAFLQGQSAEQPPIAALRGYPNVDGIYFDADEWADPWVRGNKILHIELRRWADMMVIAPLSASALAKMVHGFSDNLLLSVVRAWDTTGLVDPVREIRGANVRWTVDGDGAKRKRILVAPSMNTAMWMQPVTKTQVEVLRGEWGVQRGGWFEVLMPMEKELACGDVGGGAMMDWREIVGIVEERLGLR